MSERPAPAALGLPGLLGRVARRAFARRGLALALYLPGALLALLGTLPAAAGLTALSTLEPWVDRLGGADSPSVLAELAIFLVSRRAEPESPLPPALGPGLLGLLAGLFAGLFALPLQGLAYTFLAGGLLSRLLGAPERSFWADCRRWFWPLLRLGLLGLALLAPVGLAGLIGLALLSGVRERPPLGDAAVLLLGLGCLAGLLELARAELVRSGEPSARRALGRAVRRALRPRGLLLALPLWLLLGLLGAAYAALAAGLATLVPATALPAAFALQQALLLGAAWLKLLRLAAAAELANLER